MLYSAKRFLIPEVFALLLTGSALAGAQIEPARDAPQPRPPEESLKLIRVPDGYLVELVAAEPLLADPSAVTWDEKGRLFACEIHGYNLEGHLDVVELNKTGKLDKKIRRLFVGPETIRRARAQTYGTVKLLEDTDGDGRMDRAKVFADRLPACYGMVPWRGGLIVVCAPDIVYLADRDGDGKAEVRETLFTGFKVSILERAINNPRWGLDGWIYVASGGGGGLIRGPKLPKAVALGNTDFRIKPDGTAIEPVTGRCGTFGLALTEFGDRFGIGTSSAGFYAPPLPYRYLMRNPHVASPSVRVGAAGYHRVYPASRPHPWRLARGKDPRWVKFYGAREATPNGNFTSACGPAIWRGDYFCCDPQQNMVHRAVLERDGAGWRLRRAPGEETSEFLASTEGWFRPMNLTVGPDGALYVVDFYREIIEDYSAIPRHLQQQYGLIKGADRGRIWRVVREGASPKQPARERVRALYKGNGDLEAALADASWGVRVHALRLADGRKELLPAVLNLAEDPDPAVRLQVAMTLGEFDDERAVRTLARLGAKHGDERWMEAAILSSALKTAPELLAEVIRLKGRASLVKSLARLVGVRHSDGALVTALRALAGAEEPHRTAGLQGLAAGLPRGEKVVLKSREGSEALGRLMVGPSRRLAMQLSARLTVGDPSFARKAFDDASRTALDPKASPEQRRWAVGFLSNASIEVVAKTIAKLLAPAEPVDLQLVAVAAVAESDDAKVGEILLAGWKAHSPRVRGAILDAILERSNRLPALIDALKRGTVRSSDVAGFHRARLRELADVKFPAPAGKPVEKYRAALGSGDATRGMEVFSKVCAKCHKMEGKGADVGPDLSGVNARADEAILMDIFYPGDRITPGYGAYLVETKGGRTVSGTLADETATSVTLRGADQAGGTILRKDIKRMVASELSLMPDNMEKVMTPQDVADVIAYLRKVTGPLRPSTVMLFDDDPAMVGKLNQGGGKASIVEGGAPSGRAYLSVTPPQRYSPRINGWSYRIVEKPGPGEYRYLRLAWKAKGEGVMVELAAGGNWPPAESPKRRYYSGKNTTKWQARRVSSDVPRKWTSVTVDLWKDCGPFTLTGIAPTAMGGTAFFDRIELLRRAGED